MNYFIIPEWIFSFPLSYALSLCTIRLGAGGRACVPCSLPLKKTKFAWAPRDNQNVAKSDIPIRKYIYTYIYLSNYIYIFIYLYIHPHSKPRPSPLLDIYV